MVVLIINSSSLKSFYIYGIYDSNISILSSNSSNLSGIFYTVDAPEIHHKKWESEKVMSSEK